jgi:hypothetical protein
MDSLQERVKSALAQLADQSGLSEGLSQRLVDLESSLQGQFNTIETKFQQLLDATSESREGLALQAQQSHILSTEFTLLKSEHQGLLEQGDKQNNLFEAMTAEYDKHQEASEQMVHRLDQLGAQVESTRSSGTHQGMAIGGLFLLLLLSLLLGYQFFTSKLGGVERDLSLELMKASENYLTRQQIYQLMDAAIPAEKSINEALAVEALIAQQQIFVQRLDKLEQQLAVSMAAQAQPPQGTEPAPDVHNEALDATKDVPQEKQQPTLTLQQPKPPEARWQAFRERGGYTIQLVGVSSQDTIAGFIAKHGLQGGMAYITTQREGRAWHILLYGMYDTYTEASKALLALPESLKRQQAWVRKMPDGGSISEL